MKFIPTAISSKVGLTLLKTQKNSPKIMFVAGVAGMVGTVVLASRATLKLEETLDETRSKLYDIRSTPAFDGYTEEDKKKHQALVYVRGVAKVAKLYALPTAVGVASIALLTGSHHVLSSRNVALTTAYTGLAEAFDKYRARVAEDVGEEKEKKYRYGLQKVDVVEFDENGKQVKSKIKVPTALSEYARLYRPGLPNWQNVAELNLLFLRGIQNTCNDKLRANGYLFLNDVYDMLGFDRTKAGQLVGWLRDGDGDGYVDFGIFEEAASLRIFEYITGLEEEILLDFNVDGIVYDKI